MKEDNYMNGNITSINVEVGNTEPFEEEGWYINTDNLIYASTTNDTIIYINRKTGKIQISEYCRDDIAGEDKLLTANINIKIG
jgi:hypothetical protein